MALHERIFLTSRASPQFLHFNLSCKFVALSAALVSLLNHDPQQRLLLSSKTFGSTYGVRVMKKGIYRCLVLDNMKLAAAIFAPQVFFQIVL